MVCTGCHQALGGGLKVGATGEFRVPSPPLFEESEASGERPLANGSCSWCSKPEDQVKKLLGRGTTALCDECVSLACDILDAELGTDWR